MYSSHYENCSCAYPHRYTFEPWSRQRTLATWAVSLVCLVALAIGLPLVRDANERSWCSGSVGHPTDEQCLLGQEGLRCGPLGVIHCASGGD